MAQTKTRAPSFAPPSPPALALPPRARRPMLALGLGLLGLTLPGCGEDPPASRNQVTDSSGELTGGIADRVPTIGLTDMGPEAADWQPSFEELTGQDPRPSSSQSAGTSTQEAPPSSAADSTNNSTTSEKPGPTSASLSEASSTIPDSSSQTGTSTETDSDESTPTSSQTGTSTDTGEIPDNTQEAPLDPNGPQFGFQLNLHLQGPALPPGNYRAMVFEFEAHRSTSETPRAQPEVSELSVRPEQPKVRFTPAGNARFILRSPDQSRINPETGQSQPHAVAIYLDRNDDGAWSENEVFVAALPHSLIYEQANSEHPERWRKTKDGPQGAQDLLASEPTLSALPQTLSLARLDAARPAVRIGGLFENVKHRGVDFIASISPGERQDLASHFWSGPRPIDHFLRDTNKLRWTIQATGAPAGSRRALPVIEIPGIKAEFTATNWLVGYRRPIGAPLESPNKFLTPDSEIIAEVCVPRSSAALGFWIQEGAWASSPVGALYASWYALGVGWGFVAANTENAPFYYYPEPKLMDDLKITTQCKRR